MQRKYEVGLMIFALLAHEDEHTLAAQLDNIRHFNPGSRIVLYNGGTDPDFARRFELPICPYSRPLNHGNLTFYMWDVMRWLEEEHVDYEYLINLDHDLLFVKHGFQAFLNETMGKYDCMGWDMVTSRSSEDSELTCVQTMWDEWHLWKPVFQTDHFIRFLNPAQVYRHQLVRCMLASVDRVKMERMFSETRVFALEEMFFVTLALSCGGKIREYPRDETWHKVARFQWPGISHEEAYHARDHPYYFWVHPVKGIALFQMHQWLMSGASFPQEALSTPEEPAAKPQAASSEVQRYVRRRNHKAKRNTKVKRKPVVKKKKISLKRTGLRGSRRRSKPLLYGKMKSAKSIRGRLKGAKGRGAKKHKTSG
ncbi:MULTISPECIES: hypothetical protein [unclassified Paenibacillus]|uniref:hypothetical protein n=1 Tax=unclassified Paenibacillus TaxID=185978 RepID=UPI001AE175E2|nr:MULTISPECIES: hypothetical protein [unclassified Paenibacillus]MBP1156660.1 hypothetical protein [Paenibacillus sp. PvP091]MBP1172602.1 hypothetical protein [Paenibacillus sp. PvR098]MBP2438982.1 hypothetical protein [Paenibacillus sp. PvP052]